jgi:hypothetical protein
MLDDRFWVLDWKKEIFPPKVFGIPFETDAAQWRKENEIATSFGLAMTYKD